MSETLENIKTTFNNLIKIYQETGNLLLDAESILEQKGYYCDHGNTVGTGQSKNINNPSWWITPYASRYLPSEENPTEIKALGVFFIGVDHQPIDPLVIYGHYSMKKKENGESMGYDYWYLLHTWFDLIEDKKLSEDIKFEEKWNFIGGKIRAVPLDDVKDQETLKKHVIDPLIAMSLE